MNEKQILDEIDYIYRLHAVAAREIGFPIRHPSVEAVYTKHILKFLKNPDLKISVHIIIKEIFKDIKKNWTYLTEIQNENLANPEELNVDANIIRKANCFKELIGEEWYDRFISYYNSVAPGKKLYTHNTKARQREASYIGVKKRRTLKKIAQSPELQAIFA